MEDERNYFLLRPVAALCSVTLRNFNLDSDFGYDKVYRATQACQYAIMKDY